MLVRPKPPEETVSGLRTRYTPRTRINQGLIGAAPWLNLLLLMVMFGLFQSTFVLRPGFVMRLPEAAFSDGTIGKAVIAVVVAVEPSGKHRGGEAIFFDDLRYEVGVADDAEKLKTAFSRRVREHPGETLVVQADDRVDHGTVMWMVGVAHTVGMPVVNLAIRAK
jgi:biopolymer transport protein ExbD